MRNRKHITKGKAMTMIDFTYGHANSRPSKAGFLTKLLSFAALRKQRNDLANLTSAQLADIGVSAKEASIEAQKPVWDVPSNWRA